MSTKMMNGERFKRQANVDSCAFNKCIAFHWKRKLARERKKNHERYERNPMRKKREKKRHVMILIY